MTDQEAAAELKALTATVIRGDSVVFRRETWESLHQVFVAGAAALEKLRVREKLDEDAAATAARMFNEWKARVRDLERELGDAPKKLARLPELEQQANRLAKRIHEAERDRDEARAELAEADAARRVQHPPPTRPLRLTGLPGNRRAVPG